jgi:hypothetical protein
MRYFASLALAPLLLLAGVGAGRADDASDQKSFHDFLVQAKSGASADKEKVNAFYKTSGAYWRAHWLDYSLHPENYADVMALYRANQALYPRPFQVPDPERYRKDIELFKEFDSGKPGLVCRQFDHHEVEDRRILSRLLRDQPGFRRQRHRGCAVLLQGRDREIPSLRRPILLRQ